MKTVIRVVLLLLALIGLSSCLGKVQYYEHKPTHSFRYPHMNKSGFKKLQSFTDNGVVFIPDLVYFVPSRLPLSRLRLFSQTIKSIYIAKAILHSGSRIYNRELTLNNEVMINEKFKTFYTEHILLFGNKIREKEAYIAEYGKIWAEDTAILEVYYRFPGEGDEGALKKMEFKLELKTATDIAWST